MKDSNLTARIERFGRGTPFAPKEVLSPWLEPGRTRVADVGSGTGLWALEAARLGAKVVYAIDQHAGRVAGIAEAASAEGLENLQALLGRAESLPLDPASIDLALAALVLHEVRELTAALAEVRRVLAREGRLVVVELLPNPAERHPRLALQELVTALREQGFAVLTSEEREGWYCVTAQRKEKESIE